MTLKQQLELIQGRLETEICRLGQLQFAPLDDHWPPFKVDITELEKLVAELQVVIKSLPDKEQRIIATGNTDST